MISLVDDVPADARGPKLHEALEFFTIEALDIRRRMRRFVLWGSMIGLAGCLVAVIALALAGGNAKPIYPSLVMFLSALPLGILGSALRSANVSAVHDRVKKISREFPADADIDSAVLWRCYREHRLPALRRFALASILFEVSVDGLVFVAMVSGIYSLLTI